MVVSSRSESCLGLLLYFRAALLHRGYMGDEGGGVDARAFLR
jgi:hypothetical protein